METRSINMKLQLLTYFFLLLLLLLLLLLFSEQWRSSVGYIGNNEKYESASVSERVRFIVIALPRNERSLRIQTRDTRTRMCATIGRSNASRDTFNAYWQKRRNTYRVFHNRTGSDPASRKERIKFCHWSLCFRESREFENLSLLEFN